MTDPPSKPRIKLCRIEGKLKEDANLFSTPLAQIIHVARKNLDRVSIKG